jgi:hypothetical protein
MFNKHQYICAVFAAIVSIILNLLLPNLVKKIASKEEISQENGVYSLSFTQQLMHMLVHHAQVPLTSSILVSVITFLSVLFGYKLKCFLKIKN